MTKQTAGKILRWALRLFSYNYTIKYITGMANLWADLMTRWAAPLASMLVSRLFITSFAPFLAAVFIWPTKRELDEMQQTKEHCVLPTTTHDLTTAYCPWADVSVERVCREV
jgi:hypothetical protein